jgi:hypothetical protein
MSLYQLPAGLTEQAYLDFFKNATQSPITLMLFGQTTVIDERLFYDARGQLKITKRGRERYILYLADTIFSPDAIYESVEVYRLKIGETLTKRRFLKTFHDETGRIFYTIVAFTWDAEQAHFFGATAFVPFNRVGEPDEAYFEKQKIGRNILPKK